jgi:thioredoxin 1
VTFFFFVLWLFNLHFIVKAIRSFSVAQPRFTGKTVEGTSETFDSLVTNADHPVIVDFYAE